MHFLHQMHHNGCGSLYFSFVEFPRYLSSARLAKSCPPSPNAIANPSIEAPKTIENAASTVCRASPSSSSAMEIAKIQITKRIDQLQIFGERTPAFTEASSAARDKKFANTNPRN